MLDEIDDPNWHQWLCLCRLLMFHHPVVGADSAELLDKGPPAEPGWHRRRSPLKEFDTFTFIDHLKGGETRFIPPSDAHISDARPFTALDQTEIWRIARHLASILDQTTTLESIKRSAFLGRSALKEARRCYTVSMTSQFGGRGNEWFRWAPHAIVDAYMRFEVPGVVASDCLGRVLVATIDSLCKKVYQVKSIPTIRGALSSHYSEMVYKLVRKRRSCNVSGYYQLSYLASLYALTAAVIGDGLEAKLDPVPSDSLKRTLLNTEEKACDLLSATFFALPARYSTIGILMFMVGHCRLAGKSMKEAVSAYNLHPALTAALSPNASAVSVAAYDSESIGISRYSLVEGENLEDVQQRVQARYIAESHRMTSVDLRTVLHGEFNPIHERIDALLKPVMDVAAIRKTMRGWKWP